MKKKTVIIKLRYLLNNKYKKQKILLKITNLSGSQF